MLPSPAVSPEQGEQILTCCQKQLKKKKKKKKFSLLTAWLPSTYFQTSSVFEGIWDGKGWKREAQTKEIDEKIPEHLTAFESFSVEKKIHSRIVTNIY